MNIIAIIQARMGSERLPGKVMREIKGKPLIGYLLERVACAHELDGVIVAIPKNDVGSPLASYLRKLNVAYFAGAEENDVTARFLAVLDECKPDAFVRICGDSPLIDPALIDFCVREFRDALPRPDFAANEGAPSGQRLEIVKTAHYRAHAPYFTPAQREHAGMPYFCAAPKLSVDTEEDFQRVARVIEQMTKDHIHYGMDECFQLCTLQ